MNRPNDAVAYAGRGLHGLDNKVIGRSRAICCGWGRIAIRKSLSFRPGEAENLVDAQIFGKRGPSGSPVHALGGALAIAAQRAPDHGGDRLGRMHSFGHQSEQPVTRKAPKKFIIERNDRLVAARVALTAGAPKELAVDATRLVVFRQDDMQAACARTPPGAIGCRCRGRPCWLRP